MSTSYLIVALCVIALSCAPLTAEVSHCGFEPDGLTFDAANLLPLNGASASLDVREQLPKLQPSLLSVNFGEVIRLKASYFAKREPLAGVQSTDAGATPQQYFNLLATSGRDNGALISEAEIAYSQIHTLGVSQTRSERPMMRRVAVASRWEALTYGAQYKSSDAGFVSLKGAKTDIGRADAEIWAERSWAALKFRGSMTQTWEKPSDTPDVRVTRSAAVILNYSQTPWAGSLASTYALVKEGTISDDEIRLARHTVSASYRPISSISLTPRFSLTHHWNATTATQREPPETALTLVYTPHKDSLKLTGTASFIRAGAADPKTLRAATALDYNLGKFRGTRDTLSVTLDVYQRLDRLSPGSSSRDVRTMLLWKVAGF